MNDRAHAESRSEAAMIFRWVILFPTFAVLVLLSANFTLGFFQWIATLDGWLLYAMIPIAVLIVLSNGLASFIACMIAPRKRPATILLGLGHMAGMLYGYWQFDWAEVTSIGLALHALMVYLGLAAVYYLDRLHSQESDDAIANPQPDPIS
ncbi:hypothetical protein ACFLRO_01110 [Bacteroidota bacterium]